MYQIVESLYHTPKTNTTLCVKYIVIKIKKSIKFFEKGKLSGWAQCNNGGEEERMN